MKRPKNWFSKLVFRKRKNRIIPINDKKPPTPRVERNIDGKKRFSFRNY